MRNPEDVLNDICIAFGTTHEEFLASRDKRKVNDRLSLVTQAFVYVALNTFCINSTELSKIIGRSGGIVSIMNQKAKLLIDSNHSYAENFKDKIKNSCTEGELLILKLTK